MNAKQLEYLNSISEEDLENIIDLSKDKTQQEITNFINDEYMLISVVDKDYTETCDIDYSDIPDSDLLSELGDRSWNDSEVQDIFQIIEDQLNFDADDLYHMFVDLSDKQQKSLIDDIIDYEQNEFKCVTLYDEMKIDILKEIFKKCSLEQLQELQKIKIN